MAGIAWACFSATAGSITTSSLPQGQELARHYRDQLGSGTPRQLQQLVQKGAELTCSSPVHRAKSGNASYLTCDARAVFLGATITGANANEGMPTQKLLESLGIEPPPPEKPAEVIDERGLPDGTANESRSPSPGIPTSRTRAPARRWPR